MDTNEPEEMSFGDGVFGCDGIIFMNCYDLRQLLKKAAYCSWDHKDATYDQMAILIPFLDLALRAGYFSFLFWKMTLKKN